LLAPPDVVAPPVYGDSEEVVVVVLDGLQAETAARTRMAKKAQPMAVRLVLGAVLATAVRTFIEPPQVPGR
jgi:hypothetical protein